MPDEAHVRHRTLPLERNFDLMIRDPLFEALNTNAQRFISPHFSPDSGKPYSRPILAINCSN